MNVVTKGEITLLNTIMVYGGDYDIINKHFNVCVIYPIRYYLGCLL